MGAGKPTNKAPSAYAPCLGWMCWHPLGILTTPPPLFFLCSAARALARKLAEEKQAAIAAARQVSQQVGVEGWVGGASLLLSSCAGTVRVQIA